MTPTRYSRRLRLRAIAATAIIGVAVAAGACGGDNQGRSVEAFCTTMKSEKQRILDQFDAGTYPADSGSIADILAGPAATVQAFGELRSYFDRLAAVAPEQIRVPMQIVADEYAAQFEKMSDIAKNPLAALAGNMFGALAISGQLNEVDTYAREHCGEGI